MNIGDRVRWGERTGTVEALGFGTETSSRWWDGFGRKPRGELEKVLIEVDGETWPCRACGQEAPVQAAVAVSGVEPLDLFTSGSRHAVDVETGGRT